MEAKRDFVAQCNAELQDGAVCTTTFETRGGGAAAFVHGIQRKPRPRGLIAMSTVMTDAAIREVLERAQAAFADVAAEPD
jgi:DNA-binding LacI/PurR family transcriptional regulator